MSDTTMEDVNNAIKCGNIHHNHIMRLVKEIGDQRLVIERIQALSKQRIGLRLPLDTAVKQINDIANDYLGSK